MDLQTFQQKALAIIESYHLTKLYTGVDVTWCLQNVGGGENVCTCQIVAVTVRNAYILVKEVTPEAALSVFESKVAQIAQSKSVASTMYFNQTPAQA